MSFFEFGSVLAMVLVALMIVFAALVFSRIVAPRKPDPEKASTYECGERPFGTAWMRFNVRFYVVALVFIVFDVEVAVLFPWAVVFRDFVEKGQGGIVLFEALVFMAILLVGLVYVWGRGDLEWVRTFLGEKKHDEKQA